MTVFRKSAHSWRRAAWLTALVVVFTTAWVATNRAQTQDDSSPEASSPAATMPYSLLQYSTLTGSGNTITAVEVPVVTSTGATIYKDVTLQFNVDASGNLTVTSGYPKVILSKLPSYLAFEAGNYVGPSTVLNGEALITVSGPGITKGGATEWALTDSPGANPCTYPTGATWWVGPLASNPYATRIAKANIPAATVNAYSWGVTGSVEPE